MLLLVTGASGAGKSTVRRLIESALAPGVECVELRHVVSMPPWPTKAWRQQASEAVVRRALERQEEGRHLEVQAKRLARRGDDPALLVHHQAFADWMRGHAHDPRHMPHVLTIDGWEAMRWERLTSGEARAGAWRMHVIDTSELSPEQVAAEALVWAEHALAGQAPIMRA